MTQSTACFTFARYAVVLGCLLAAWSNTCVGQAIDARPAAEPTAVSKEQRAQMYQQLRQRAEVLQAQADVLKLAAKLAGPTVVHIDPRGVQNVTLEPGQRPNFGEAGAGVIIRWIAKHYVLTNAHVIHGLKPEQIKPSLIDGRRLSADRVWEDVESDVAVMAVAEGDLSDAPLGDSDGLEVGEHVLAIGSPFGLSHSVTNGIISGKGRRDLDLSHWGVRYQDFLQTDAAINPGNSGGPLLNLRGEVVAINTAFLTNSGGNQGVGFAIPINVFMRIAGQLIEHGKVQRASLGITVDADFGPSQAAKLGLSRYAGALVGAVAPDSPAAAAQLRPGDVILTYGGTPLESNSHLVNLVGLSEVGKTVTLQVFRQAKVVQARLVTGDRDASARPTALASDRR